MSGNVMSGLPAEPVLTVETWEELVYLLGQACEIEHGVMCEYPYAQFSLKRGLDEGLTGAQLARVQGWERALIAVIKQEMLHLALATNVLTAIGAAPHFERPNFPILSRWYPPGDRDDRRAGRGGARRLDQVTLRHLRGNTRGAAGRTGRRSGVQPGPAGRAGVRPAPPDVESGTLIENPITAGAPTSPMGCMRSPSRCSAGTTSTTLDLVEVFFHFADGAGGQHDEAGQVSHVDDVDAAGPALQQADRAVERPAGGRRTVVPHHEVQEPRGWHSTGHSGMLPYFRGISGQPLMRSLLALSLESLASGRVNRCHLV
jgi:Ferritin-like